MKEKKLTPRQWHLYDLLKDNSNQFLTIETIYNHFKLNYPNEYSKPEENTVWNNSSTRRLITRDIQQINNNETIQKIIIFNTKLGIKLATEEEFWDYERKEKAKILSMLKRHYTKVNKAKSNGQMKLPIDEYARNIIEAFVKGENE